MRKFFALCCLTVAAFLVTSSLMPSVNTANAASDEPCFLYPEPDTVTFFISDGVGVAPKHMAGLTLNCIGLTDDACIYAIDLRLDDITDGVIWNLGESTTVDSLNCGTDSIVMQSIAAVGSCLLESGHQYVFRLRVYDSTYYPIVDQEEIYIAP